MKNNFFKNSLSAIDSLIEKGVYNEKFTQPTFAQAFVKDIFSKFINNNTRKVLECGCGTGFWLKYISTMYPNLDLYGFDLSRQMLIIAEQALRKNKKILLKKGDILCETSFEFGNIREFDIIFCYDVIQQLSEKDYFTAIRNILSHLSSRGIAIIIDSERYSFYGVKRNIIKAITRLTKIPFVPFEFCNIRYPSLKKIAKELHKAGYQTDLLISNNKIKLALIIFNKNNARNRQK